MPRSHAEDQVMIATTPHLPGYRVVEYHGMVWGLTVRAKNVGVDFLAGCKKVVGGEIGGYTDLLYETRQQAIDRMADRARRLGANAVLAVQFGTSVVSAQGMAEIVAYGTAVTVEPEE